MSDKTGKNFFATGNGKQADDTVAKLMNLAGPRADIPEDIETRVHDTVRHAWRKATNRKVALRWAIPASLAAIMLLTFAFNMRAPETILRPVGSIAHIAGVPDTGSAAFAVGDAVYAGDSLVTGPDRGISIAFARDVSLRVAASTQLRVESPDEITLIRGQIYVDSGDRIYRDWHITVHTPGGSARDIGTQFAVAYEGDRMSVAVREGRVDVAHDQSAFTALAGERLTLRPGREVVVDQITPYDPSWQWATSLAPHFDMENRTLMDFLKWASRETGKSLDFAGDDVRMAAMRTEIFGSIAGFNPAEAIDSVLSTTQFGYQVDEKSITITQ